MAYDLGKISALEAHHQIVDHISKQLAACSAFNNNSLAYFGIEVKYRVELTLHSRGKTREDMKAEFRVGDSVNEELVQQALAGQGVEAQTDHVVITDEQVAGSAARKLGYVASQPAVTGGGKGAEAGGAEAGPDVGKLEPSGGDKEAQRADVATGGAPVHLPPAGHKGRGRG